MEVENGSENNFPEWDDFSSEEDFFAMDDGESLDDDPAPDPKKKKSGVSEDDEDDDPAPDGDDPAGDKDDLEEDFFTLGEDNDEEDDSGDDPAGDKDEPNLGTNVQILNTLKERGLVDFELEEDQELTEELAEDLVEQGYENEIESRVKELFEELPPVVKQMNKFALNGGNINEFLAELTKTQAVSLSEEMDLSEESNQETATRELLKLEGEESEDIEAQIKFLKETGRLEKFSKKKFGKWKVEAETKREALVESKKQDKIAQAAALKAAKRDIQKTVSTVDNIGSVTLSKEDKKILPSYMNDKTVKLQNGATITELEKELFYDLRQNKEAYLQLATLMRNRNEDGTFNFEGIKKAIKTDVANNIKKNVRRTKSISHTSGGTASGTKTKALADYFNI